MRGSDLLDKLENLDLNLVAGAAAPPSVRARPKDRWWLPALTAAARSEEHTSELQSP